MKRQKTWLFVLLLSLVAIVISGTAAYFSVFGLAKLFAGAGVSALILFGSLEIGKLVSVSVLYRFWKEFSWLIKIPFTLMVIGIMFITSMGIYGFLRNAYDVTSNRYNTIQKEVLILDQRKSTYSLEIGRYQTEIDSKNKQINTYIENKSIQEQSAADLYRSSADTNMTTNQSWVFRTRAKQTQDAIGESTNLISSLREQNTGLYSQINTLNDSISSIDRNILELESSDISIEIGPLKYLSDYTGYKMDDVVGFLIFLIIFVFDPFAIILIIAANRLSMVVILEPINEIENIDKERKNYFKNIFKSKKKNKINSSEPIENNTETIDKNTRKSGIVNRWVKKIKSKRQSKTINDNINVVNSEYTNIVDSEDIIEDTNVVDSEDIIEDTNVVDSEDIIEDTNVVVRMLLIQYHWTLEDFHIEEDPQDSHLKI